MKTPTIIATALTVAAIGATPAVASAATKCDGGGASCRIALNHNEVLVTSAPA
jgi:hypothetical protein